jgi:uncharacterized membrane protein
MTLPLFGEISRLGLAHLGSALMALVFGGVVFAQEKGTRLHRLAGWGYVLAMLALNTAALSLYRDTGHFGPFHWLAVFSLATLLAGLWNIRFAAKRDRGIPVHAHFMAGSYVGVVAAGASQVAVHVPTLASGWTVVAVSLAVAAVGLTLSRRKIRPILGRMGIPR